MMNKMTKISRTLSLGFVAFTLPLVAHAEKIDTKTVVANFINYANEVKIDSAELDRINAIMHQTNIPSYKFKAGNVVETVTRVGKIVQSVKKYTDEPSGGAGTSPTTKAVVASAQTIKPVTPPTLEDGGYSNLLYGEPSPDSLLQFITSYNRKLSYPMAYEISTHIHQVAQEYGLNPHFLMSLVAVESSFNPFAISKTGAMGLGQLKPDTAQWLGVDDPFNPRQNLRGAAKYLRFLLDKYKGRADLALAAYYKGQGTIDRKGVDDDARYYVSKVNKIWSQIN